MEYKNYIKFIKRNNRCSIIFYKLIVQLFCLLVCSFCWLVIKMQIKIVAITYVSINSAITNLLFSFNHCIISIMSVISSFYFINFYPRCDLLFRSIFFFKINCIFFLYYLKFHFIISAFITINILFSSFLLFYLYF